MTARATTCSFMFRARPRALILLTLTSVLMSWSGLAQEVANDEPPARTAESAVNQQPAEVEDPAFGKLPWADQQDQLGNLPARRLTSPRELLHLFSIDDSQLAVFVDGEPLGARDEETILSILYRLPRFPLNDLQRWAKPSEELAAVAANPGSHRADAFLLRGRTMNIERVEILPETAEHLEFDHYYRVMASLDGRPDVAVLCVREIPEAWLRDGAGNQPISAIGLFLKQGRVSDDRTEYVFATPRVAWLPDQSDAARGITPDQTYLASLGMDIGLFDDVRRLHRKPLSQGDREAFYQLLAAVGNSNRDEFRARVLEDVDLASLLPTPATQHGRLMLVRGTARRALRIRVDDADVQERFGMDHYYQLDVFIPLGDQVVRLGSRDHEESPTFTNTFPVTVCVLRLPPGLPEGADISTEVTIPASFFKLWAYRSRFVSAFDQHQLQVSPMFMGVEPHVVSPATAGNSYFGIGVAIVFVALVAVAWFMLWRASRSDSRFQRKVLGPRYELPPGQSLNDGAISSRDEGDFSHLE